MDEGKCDWCGKPTDNYVEAYEGGRCVILRDCDACMSVEERAAAQGVRAWGKWIDEQ